MRLVSSVAAALLLSCSMAVAGADNDLRSELEALKKELQELKQVVKKSNIEGMKKELGSIKKQALGDNLKLSADYRFSYNNISYKFADGSSSSNSDLMTNRVWITAKAAPRDDLSFFLTMAYNKSFGDSANHSQANTNPGYADFDWITNENALDGTLKLKEAYFVYFGNMFDKVPYTASVGRRPSTNGLPVHLREDDAMQSPNAHIINVETDAASFRFDFDKVTGISGMYFKLCLGRGLTNAKARFQMSGDDYAKDESINTPDIDMRAFIFQPWSDGQYTIRTDYYMASNMIGFDMSGYNTAYGSWLAGTGSMADVSSAYNSVMMNGFEAMGDWAGGAVTVYANGIGDFWSDFLDETKLFVSYAFSKTMPESGKRMLGSSDDEMGHSWYAGVQIPAYITDDARFGLEYNMGSKYWRSITYAEDTLSGSKLAARGSAWEVYYQQPILKKTLTADLRFTTIDYDYTGSNMFFGDEGAPQKISDISPDAFNNPVDKVNDLRLSLRYRY